MGLFRRTNAVLIFFSSLYNYPFTKRMTHSLLIVSKEHPSVIHTDPAALLLLCPQILEALLHYDFSKKYRATHLVLQYALPIFLPPPVYVLLHSFLIKCNGWVAHVQRLSKNSICLKGRGSVKVLVICSYKGWCLQHTWFEKRECPLKGFTISHTVYVTWNLK